MYGPSNKRRVEFKMEKMFQKLRSNLSQDSLDMDPDLSSLDLQHALNHSSTHPQEHTEEKLVSFQETIEEYKFNQKLQIISIKRQHIPNLQDVNDLANLVNQFPRLSYKDFLEIRNQMSSEMSSRFFTAEVFDTFQKSADTSIDTQEFLKYVQRAVDIETLQFELLQYADTYLKSLSIPLPGQKLSPSMTVSMTETEVEAYIYDSIPHIPLLTAANLHETFIPFYVFTAVRRIFFFLDSLRTKKITIHKLSHSQEMDEFLWLQRLDQYREDYATQRAYQKEIDSNWFSASNAIRLYEAYVASDKDGNGMLNQVELTLFRGVPKRGKQKDSLGQGLGSNAMMLTPLAVSRIFQENVTYQPAEMDFRSFLDLILATEYRDRPESLKYLWRLIDINHDGLLTIDTITQFYRDIRMVLSKQGYEAAPSTKDVCIEIMDMLGNPKPDSKDSAEISTKGVSFKQLQACGQGSTVLWILLDANQFWLYDNRESLPSSDENEEEEDAEEESPYSSDEEFDEENGGSDPPATQRTTLSEKKIDPEDDLYNFY